MINVLSTASNTQKQIVEAQAEETWGELKIVVHREMFDLRELPFLVAISDTGDVLGYCYYRFSTETEIEIMAVETMLKNSGVGSKLIESMIELAKHRGCKRLYLTTTNDNICAIRYYQRRGFSICGIRLNELDYSRELKPSITLTGDNDIPIMHEIEFEISLESVKKEKL